MGAHEHRETEGVVEADEDARRGDPLSLDPLLLRGCDRGDSIALPLSLSLSLSLALSLSLSLAGFM